MDFILLSYIVATVLVTNPQPGRRDVVFVPNFNVIANTAKVRLILHNPARQVITVQLEKNDHTIIHEELIMRKTRQFYTVYNLEDLDVGKYFFVVKSGPQIMRYVFYIDPPFIKPYESTKVVSMELL